MRPQSLREETLFQGIVRREKPWAIAFRRFFSKFGHSSEFRVFCLENIENLVLNLRPGSVYSKSSFRYGPSFSTSKIMREIRNFGPDRYFRILFFGSHNVCQSQRVGGNNSDPRGQEGKEPYDPTKLLRPCTTATALSKSRLPLVPSVDDVCYCFTLWDHYARGAVTTLAAKT